jgi:AraC-like DNA-binding protein
MNRLAEKLMGKGRYPFPLDKMENYMKYYESSAMNILIAKTNISFSEYPDTHVHDSYEFLMPFTPMPHIGCGGKCIYVPKDMILPINTGQEHGPMEDMPNSFFAAMHIDPGFLRGVALEAYGSRDIVFRNEPAPISRELKTLISKFAEEAAGPRTGKNLVLECISTQIAVQLIRDFEAYGKEDCFAGKPYKNEHLRDVVAFLSGNYTNGDYSTQSAAKKANLSKYHFIRAFRNETGKTPYHFILDMRIRKAMELLKENSHTITEICFLCGFINHSHFTATFRKKVGMSPRMFRKVNSLC